MRGIPSSFVLVFLFFVVLIELASYYGIKTILKTSRTNIRKYFIPVYLFFSIVISGAVLFSFSNPEIIRQSKNYTFFILVITAGFANLIPKVFITIGLLFSFIQKLIFSRRIQLLTISSSIIIGFGVLISILFAVIFGKNNINVNTHKLELASFPESLNQITIVQISDIHLGSYKSNTKVISKIVDQVNKIEPDLILFTGDIVNNFAYEFDSFIPILSKLKSKYGNFAISGNHDYGDYSRWNSKEEKDKNLEDIKIGITDSGFKLLINSSEKIQIGDTSIFITGVENWGHRPFPKYANLELASQNIPDKSFKILLTHDPAHWEAEIISKTDFPLTLSGHTHGAQFGIKLAGINFSLMYFVQKYWGGLYKVGEQYLYVNTGIGTVGFPGRIDMNPEITELIISGIKGH